MASNFRAQDTRDTDYKTGTMVTWSQQASLTIAQNNFTMARGDRKLMGDEQPVSAHPLNMFKISCI